MANLNTIKDNKNTNVQALSELVQWFISDREIELRFVPQVLNKGSLAPEFEFRYFYGGRRITERCLSMLIMSELARRNYSYQLSKIIASLTEFSWRFYMEHQEYPKWIQEDKHVVRKKAGRPRKIPKRLEYEPVVSVNTSKDDI